MVGVAVVGDPARPAGGVGGGREGAEDVGGVEVGLVAVPVVVLRLDGDRLLLGHAEEVAQAAEEDVAAAHELGEAREVVGGVPQVLHGVALGVEVLPDEGVDVGDEAAVLAAGDHQLADGVVGVAVVAGALVEHGGVVRFAEVGGEAGEGEVVVGGLEGPRDAGAAGLEREVAEFDVVLDVAAAGVGAVRGDRCHGGLAHGGVGEVDLVGGDGEALGVAVGEHDGGGLAEHAAGVAGAEGPAGHVAAVAGHAGERAEEGGLVFGVEEGEEGVLGAEGVPQREVGVVVEVGGVDLEVEAAVAAVDVAGEGGHQEGVVEGGVEDLEVLLAGAVELGAGEVGLPGGLGLGLCGVEVEVRGLGGEVHGGVFGVDEAEADAEDDGGVAGEFEVGADGLALAGGVVGDDEVVVPDAVAGERPREAGGEVDLHAAAALGVAAADVLEAAHAGAALVDGELGGDDLDVGEGAAEVEDDGGGLALREAEAVEADAGGGGELDADAVGEGEGVAARAGRLVGLGEGLHEAEGLDLVGGEAEGGHEGDGAVVDDAGAVHAGLAEAEDDVVLEVVAGAVGEAESEAAERGVGAGAGEAEGDLRAGEGGAGAVALAAGADEGVDPLRERGVGGHAGGRGQGAVAGGGFAGGRRGFAGGVAGGRVGLGVGHGAGAGGVAAVGGGGCGAARQGRERQQGGPQEQAVVTREASGAGAGHARIVTRSVQTGGGRW